MAPIEVPEVDMFDKTIRLVNELNVTSDAAVAHANDTSKFLNNIQEGNNMINLATTEVIAHLSILFLLILLAVLITVCAGCYCGGKWWKKKTGNKVSTAIKDNVVVGMTNIPEDSTDTTQFSPPPPFQMKDSSDDSIETITTISHNVEYIP